MGQNVNIFENIKKVGDLKVGLIYIKHFLSVLKISKTLVFFLKTSGEYSKIYRQGSVFKSFRYFQYGQKMFYEN